MKMNINIFLINISKIFVNNVPISIYSFMTFCRIAYTVQEQQKLIYLKMFRYIWKMQ